MSGLDSALLSVGRATAFPTPLQPLSADEAAGAVYAVLHDNSWNTNYAYWFPFDREAADHDARFRFSLSWGE